MNPTQNEWLVYERIDALRREADGSRLLARARDWTPPSDDIPTSGWPCDAWSNESPGTDAGRGWT